MMADKLVSPSNSMKQKNVNAARRIKHGSPKIQEVLRQRCRQRMHEKRNELFMKRRFGLTNYSQEVKEALTNIVHEEFENLASMEWIQSSDPSKLTQLDMPSYQNETFSLEDETFEIVEVMEEQWILEEYQKMLWEQKQILSMFVEEVICPICLKNSLRQIPNFVECDCGLKLPVKTGLQTLKQNIQEQVNAHSAACLDIPKFSVFHDGDNVSLCFSCMSCDVFALV